MVGSSGREHVSTLLEHAVLLSNNGVVFSSAFRNCMSEFGRVKKPKTVNNSDLELKEKCVNSHSYILNT